MEDRWQPASSQPFQKAGGPLLFHLISRFHERASIIIAFGEWSGGRGHIRELAAGEFIDAKRSPMSENEFPAPEVIIPNRNPSWGVQAMDALRPQGGIYATCRKCLPTECRKCHPKTDADKSW